MMNYFFCLIYVTTSCSEELLSPRSRILDRVSKSGKSTCDGDGSDVEQDVTRVCRDVDELAETRTRTSRDYESRRHRHQSTT